MEWDNVLSDLETENIIREYRELEALLEGENVSRYNAKSGERMSLVERVKLYMEAKFVVNMLGLMLGKDPEF